MSRLNPRQQEAVNYVGGPLLVLAGAGSVALFCIASLALLPTARGERVRKIWLGLLATGLTYAAADILAGLALIPPLSPALVGDQIVHHRRSQNE